MWTSTPFFIQEQMVDEIYTKKPTFILYKSDSDIFYNSIKVKNCKIILLKKTTPFQKNILIGKYIKLKLKINDKKKIFIFGFGQVARYFVASNSKKYKFFFTSTKKLIQKNLNKLR